MKYYAYHLALSEQDMEGAEVALIPGDPERCEMIAEAVGSFRTLAFHREFKSVLATCDEGRVLVVSSGIGGPSLAIAVEELARLGIRYFIRVGTCGAIQDDIGIGDIVISEGAIRMDGTSDHYAPSLYPACANFEVVQVLSEACMELGYDFHVGITCTSATFYPGQERYDTYTGYVIRNLQGTFQEWKELGVLNYEMEVATLFTIARVFHLQAGAVCGVLVNRNQEEEIDPEEVNTVELKLARVAARSAKMILKSYVKGGQ
ncbi:MAG: uridine phosphorylase [Candidatus Atribacteria bacterium]|nr:uridine phosphorylase [Candidatus Atribacteria bacterium]